MAQIHNIIKKEKTTLLNTLWNTLKEMKMILWKCTKLIKKIKLLKKEKLIIKTREGQRKQ